MVDNSVMSGPAIIVVAEECIHSLLSTSDISWKVHERQPGVASMWHGLSSGALDNHSRILIFSDSLLMGTSNDDRERRQTAQALVMMAKAGAVAGVVQWRKASWHEFEGLIAEEAASQGVDVGDLEYLLLPAQQGGRNMIDAIRQATESFVTFPNKYPDSVDAPLVVEEVGGAVDAAAADVSLPLAPPDLEAPLLPDAPSSPDVQAPYGVEPEADGRQSTGPAKAPGLPAAPTLKLNRGEVKLAGSGAVPSSSTWADSRCASSATAGIGFSTLCR